jgi:hypothetical protein
MSGTALEHLNSLLQEAQDDPTGCIGLWYKRDPSYGRKVHFVLWYNPTTNQPEFRKITIGYDQTEEGDYDELPGGECYHCLGGYGPFTIEGGKVSFENDFLLSPPTQVYFDDYEVETYEAGDFHRVFMTSE